MNKIILHGIIRNIEYSHTIKDINFYKAELLVNRGNGKEDLINIKFKQFSNIYNENQDIYLIGNIRTYSQRLQDKNKVDTYVFTYFDIPEEDNIDNQCEVDGRVCKQGILRRTKSGKDVIDFILANNIVSENNQILNVYIPCVAWGKLAKQIAKYKTGDNISLTGQLQSREYKKLINDKDYEIRITHELNITGIKDEI